MKKIDMEKVIQDLDEIKFKIESYMWRDERILAHARKNKHHEEEVYSEGRIDAFELIREVILNQISRINGIFRMYSEESIKKLEKRTKLHDSVMGEDCSNEKT